ncbi:hypothetical protein E9993_09520 [Labilibacter sediminis]|nr:hypothetical protein E9993_09520 [Labilibacter sediminis]
MHLLFKFRNVKYVLLIIAVSFCLVAESKVNITSILKDKYGGFSKNWAIDVDHKGMIYCGNEAGLLTYDGLKWELYKVPGNLSVRSVMVDGDRIYTGSFEQFGYWEKSEKGVLTYHSLSDSILRKDIHNDMIWKIIPSLQGGVIFQSFNTLFVFNGKEVSQLNIRGGIIFLLRVKDKLVAQRTKGNLIQYKDGKLSDVEGSEILYNSYVRMFLPYGEDAYLIGSGTKGLYIWDQKKGFYEWNCSAQEIIKNYEINAGYFDGQNYYIATLDNGVFVVNKKGEIKHHLNIDSGLESNTIFDVRCDSKGRLWVALNMGLAIVEFDFPIHYVTSRTSNLGVVHAAQFHDNRFYLGTNRGLYYHDNPLFEGDHIHLDDFKTIDQLKGHIWSLKSKDERLLCGHNSGSYEISGKNISKISKLGGGQSFVPFVINKREYLLQNTYTSLALFGENSQKSYELQYVLKGFFEPSRDLEVGLENDIWVSHVRRKEVFKVKVVDENKPLQKTNYGRDKGLPQDFGNRVCKFEDRIVFSTQEGLFTYDELRDTIVSYDDVNSQLGEYAISNNIVKTDFNKYWFTLPPKAAMFEVNEDKINKLFEYSFNDPYSSLDEKYPLIVPINDSITVFGLDNGFAFFNENTYHRTQASADSIYFKNILYRMPPGSIKSLQSQKTFSIPYRNNRIVFEYMSMASVIGGVKYEYMLEGFDKKWKVGNRINRKSYDRLPWGTYKFRVRGEDEYGNKLVPVEQIFIVAKPFFAQIWFIVLSILVSIAASVLLVLGIFRYIKHQKEILIVEKNKEWQIKHEEQQRRNQENLIKLKNEMLQKEIQHQSTELANRTIATIKRKDVLNEVKQEILKQQEHLKYSYPEKYMNRIIKKIDHSIEDEDDWKVFRSHFDLAHEDFFKRLKQSFDELTPKDLRLCAYLKMNLSTKEIAPLMNVSPRSVEVHRYKIRKKLQLDPNDNLTEFMISF